MRKTTEKGLGHRHQMVRRRLLFNHRDGEPCWWCGRPMFKDPAGNFDRAPLEADHSKARSVHGTVRNDPDRLLHSRCNRQRGDGSRDDDRPALRWPDGSPPPPRGSGCEAPFEW